MVAPRPMLLAALIVALSACGEERPGGALDADAEAGAVLVPGTPPGDLPSWITEMKAGLAEIPGLAEDDPRAAQRRVRSLYIERLEYLELYWGADRPLYAGAELEAAVEAAESRFHELMQLLQTPDASEAAVAREVAGVTAALDEVLARARAAGARLSPDAAGTPER